MNTTLQKHYKYDGSFSKSADRITLVKGPTPASQPAEQQPAPGGGSPLHIQINIKASPTGRASSQPGRASRQAHPPGSQPADGLCQLMVSQLRPSAGHWSRLAPRSAEPGHHMFVY